MNRRAVSLIVSYSYSGNTHRIARKLQKLTGGERYEIYPFQPYPAVFPELLEQARREVDFGYRPGLLPGIYSGKLPACARRRMCAGHWE